MAVLGADHNMTAVIANVDAPMTHTILELSAVYVAPHFDFIAVPPGGYITVSAPDGSQAVNYTGSRRDFYAEYIQGEAALITYTPPTDSIQASPDNAFVIDRYASGAGETAAIEAICGNDDTKPAVCFKVLDPPKYKATQAVARLLINGTSLCTGWLFGSEGHLITNNHCIPNAQTASNIQFEFGAECATCDDPNGAVQLGCKGQVVATSAEFINTDHTLDYTLVKLNVKDNMSLAKFGYLQARGTTPELGEPIYIPQHPGGKPSRIATLLDNQTIGTIESTSIQTCSPDEVGYSLDTEPGASGSPVISTKDNTVIALHNCGGCFNGAIKLNKIVDQLTQLKLLPANAVKGTSPSPNTTTPATTPSPPSSTPSSSSVPTSPVTSRPTPSRPTRAPATSRPNSPAPTLPTTAPSPSSPVPSQPTSSPAPSSRPSMPCKHKTRKPKKPKQPKTTVPSSTPSTTDANDGSY
ncbi:hypothetical protein AeMF1_013213 [Aphanomyces euteiches]|nr:hypothetical protein AeMF1_013213 [Aphanomyces euteiches]